jgi:hypothetical protein
MPAMRAPRISALLAILLFVAEPATSSPTIDTISCPNGNTCDCTDCHNREGTCWIRCWSGKCGCSGAQCIVAEGPGNSSIEPTMRLFPTSTSTPINLSTELNDGRFGFLHANPDSAGLVPVNGYIEVQAVATTTGPDSIPINVTRVTKTAAQSYAVTSDFGAIGSSSQQLSVYRGDSLVGSIVIGNNQAVTCSHWPSLVHKTGLQAQVLLEPRDTMTVRAGVSFLAVGDRAELQESGGAVTVMLKRSTLSSFHVPSIYIDGVDGDSSLANSGVENSRSPASGLVRLTVSPNPSRLETTLSFVLPVDGRVGLSVYDLGGRKLRLLDLGVLRAGPQLVRWDGRDQSHRPLRSGIYLIRLERDGHLLAATTRVVIQ